MPQDNAKRLYLDDNKKYLEGLVEFFYSFMFLGQNGHFALNHSLML